MRTNLFFAAALFLTLAVPARAGARVVTLEDALRTARENHPQLREARSATRAATARADEAFAPMLPQVTGAAAYQRTTANFSSRPGAIPSSFSQKLGGNSFDTYNYFNFGLTANQLIYDFGASPARLDAAVSAVRAQEKTEQATLLGLLLEVRKRYFEAHAALALVRVARETLDNQERHLAQIAGFVEIGTRPEIDLAQARTDRANARVQLINVENAYETAKARLNQAMGVETGLDYDVSDEQFPAVAEEDQPTGALLDEALRNRPEFAALESEVEAQEMAVRSARGGYWPSLGLSTGATDAGAKIGNLGWNWYAGFSLSWPLYQGGATQAQEMEARAGLDGLLAQKDLLRQNVRLEVEQARLAVKAARAAIEATAEAVVSASERLRLAEGRYETGVGSSIELGDAQLALTAAKAQQVQADYTLASARASLLKAIGEK